MTAVCDSEYHATRINRLSGQAKGADTGSLRLASQTAPGVLGMRSRSLFASQHADTQNAPRSMRLTPRPLGALSVSDRPHLVTEPGPDGASPRDEGRKREAAAGGGGRAE